MFRYYPEIWWPLGFLLAIGLGAVLGLFNGLLVTMFRLPAIIVTLGTLSLYPRPDLHHLRCQANRPAVCARSR